MEDASISEFKMKGLKFQYWFTILAALPLGLAIILFPELTRKIFNWKEQDRLIFGITGSAYFAFGALSALGLKGPGEVVTDSVAPVCLQNNLVCGRCRGNGGER